MADLQKYFDRFHEKIRLNDENEILREKREIVLDKLTDRLQGMFDEEEEETSPTFEPFNRGSYAMGTGVVPVDADYDIDVGLRFDLHKDDFPDPVVVKAWVYNALAGHTDDVTIMQPCVRVQYHLEGEPCYHVDIAVYAHDGNPKSLHLARGKPHSKQEYRIWQPADPIGLIEAIRTRYDNEDRSQFRRVIRYLKRWKDVQFPADGNAAPIGIGITVAAYYWFAPSRQMVDAFQNKYKYNDLHALRQFVGRLLGQFSSTYHDGEQAERLQAFLPVRPYNDLFEKMTNLQMANLRAKFSSLRETLEAVEDQEVDPVDACKKLQSHFGADFPVPEPAKTAERRAPAIVSSSSSA